MDGDRFDNLVRLVAQRAPRRAVVRGLLATAIGLPPVLAPVTSDVLAAQDSVLSEVWYFALGDSIASGHGLDDEDGPEPESAPSPEMAVCRDCDATRCEQCAVATCLACEDERICQTPCDDSLGCRPCCRRSSRYSYPARVNALLTEAYQTVHVSHLACTGASLLPPAPDQSDWRNPLRLFRHQIDAVLAELPAIPIDRPVLVSITIGANDLAFARDVQLLIHLYQDDDATFDAWVDETERAVADELTLQLDRLLAFPNVVVVLTELHNPFNESSIFFTGKNSCLGIPCYDRTDRAVRAINSALATATQRAAGSERAGIAAIHAAFQRHRSPRITCGDDGPEVGVRSASEQWREVGTWIQYRTDPESNSYSIPRLGTMVLALRNVLTGRNFTQIEINAARLLLSEWRGDCFHPNRDGANYIAAQVAATAIPLLTRATPAAPASPTAELRRHP